LIASLKKSGLTFAPEAATQRLRDVLGKNFAIDDFFSAINQAYLNGWQRIKLYFMIGLPSESDYDLKQIIDFSREVSLLKKKVSGPAALVNISINTMIPKPHTPFQWLKMEGIASMNKKIGYIKENARYGKLKLHFNDPQMSLLEAVFSRGDRRLNMVILKAFNKGARFDAWDSHFNFKVWQDSFSECGVNLDDYLKQRNSEKALAWDFLDVGINKQILKSEFNKSIASSQDKRYNFTV
jgi:radical SAM superfamily enzyme YgiQ (UPF0313 family)